MVDPTGNVRFGDSLGVAAIGEVPVRSICDLMPFGEEVGDDFLSVCGGFADQTVDMKDIGQMIMWRQINRGFRLAGDRG